MSNPFGALNEMSVAVWLTSESKGFKDAPVPMAESVANIHGEVSELWEAYRTSSLNEPCDKAEKMKALGLRPLTCLQEELADIVIRALDAARDHQVDIADAVRVKNEFNKHRPHRNGGKIA